MSSFVKNVAKIHIIMSNMKYMKMTFLMPLIRSAHLLAFNPGHKCHNGYREINFVTELRIIIVHCAT